ncbi:MAG TPA: hypothetical protein VLS48_06660 [Anaerolineales bacterium]|nr:hypothetical protein [Anaerolineales bacterium]
MLRRGFIQRIVVWFFLFSLNLMVLVSCSVEANNIQTIAPRAYPLEPGAVVVIEAAAGRIALTNGESAQVTLAGEASLANPDDPFVEQRPDGLYITTVGPRDTVSFTLQLPPGVQVKINTFDAQVNVQDFAGSLDVTTAAGDIFINTMDGLAIIRANRGDVFIESSTGEFHLPGNYGLLSLTDVSGDIEASTIMGAIRFQGYVGALDSVTFETDHGPVEAWLDSDSDVAVTVGTTTGVVHCVIPGLNPSGAGCFGQLGSGAGTLNVRTISGKVDLMKLP